MININNLNDSQKCYGTVLYHKVPLYSFTYTSFLFNGIWSGVIQPSRLRSRESWREGDRKECRGAGAWTRDLLRGTPCAVPPGHAGKLTFSENNSTFVDVARGCFFLVPMLRQTVLPFYQEHLRVRPHPLFPSHLRSVPLHSGDISSLYNSISRYVARSTHTLFWETFLRMPSGPRVSGARRTNERSASSRTIFCPCLGTILTAWSVS